MLIPKDPWHTRAPIPDFAPSSSPSRQVPISFPDLIRAAVPAELVNGETYAFSTRAEDQSGAASAWAPGCRFTIDTTAPKPPVVTSADYPAWENSGGAGVAGTFAFHPALDGVTAYTYVIDNAGPRTIQADATGTATLPWTPTAEQTGWRYLQVREHLAPRLGVANATDGRRSGGDSWDVSPRRRSRCPCRPSR
jgi:hypothetical protein